MADAAIGHVGRVGNINDFAIFYPDTVVKAVSHCREHGHSCARCPIRLDAMANQARLADVRSLIVAAVDINAFRTVASTASIGAHDRRRKRRDRCVTPEIDTRLSVAAIGDAEQVAIVGRSRCRAANHRQRVATHRHFR